MDDKVSSDKNSKRKAKTVAEKLVGGKPKTKTVADKVHEKTLQPEQKRSSDELARDEDRNKSNVGIKKGKRVAKKVKGKKSMANESKPMGGVEFGKGETAPNSDVLPEEENVEKPKTPTMKRKRGVDREIAEAFLSSPEKDSSRLRPRKEVPTFRMVELSESDCDRIVGKRVRVFWSGSRKWFVGRIKSFDSENKSHKILYDDGDKEELDLKRERFELEVIPSEAFTLCSKLGPNLEKKEMGSDGDGIGRETTKEDSCKVGDAEPGRKHAKTKKEMTSKASKRSRPKLHDGKDIEHEAENLADMEVDVLPENIEEKGVSDDVNNAGKSDVPCGKDHEETESLSKVASEINDKSDEAQATELEPNPGKKEMGSDGSEVNAKAVEEDSVDVDDAELVKNYTKMNKKLASKAAKRGGSKLRVGKDSEAEKEENLATDVEVDMPPEKVEEKAMNDEINVENPGDVNCGKDHNTSESMSKETSEITKEASGEPHETKPEILAKEENHETLEEEKQKIENSEPAGDEVEEKESGEKNILVGGSVTNTQGLQPPEDKQSENDGGQVGLESHKMVSNGESDANTMEPEPLLDDQIKKSEGMANVEVPKNPVKKGRTKVKKRK